MEVYLGLVPVKAFRRWKLRQGSKFFLILSGISISTAGGEVTVEPVYTPLIAIDRRGSLVYIEIAWKKPLAMRPFGVLVVVSSTWPFLHVERTDRITLEDE